MTSVPYPTFDKCPIASYHDLSAVGRCRISPATITDCPASSAVYADVLAKCAEHAALSSSSDKSDGGDDDDQKKKTLKRLYKQAVGALATSFFEGRPNLDRSVVHVEVRLPSRDVVATDGLLAVVFLDAGAARIVLDDAVALVAARLPPSRLVAHFESDADVATMAAVATGRHADTVSLACTGGEHTVARALQAAALFRVNPTRVNTNDNHEHGDDELQVVLQLSPADFDGDTEQLAELVGAISKEQLVVTLVDPTAEELGLSYAACCRTDRPDGLYTTVVCTRSNEALGLVYSSKSSIVASLQGDRAVYYSRSRNGLWRKGDTSGHFQVLHRVDVDCDGDALRFTVTQKGDPPAFCHLNTLTCWGRPCGVRALEETLVDRLKHAPAGSYTKRLFDDEVLLRNKLVEEAQELSEAEDRQEVAEELADVLYFAMVRAVKAGVSMDDAVSELDKKARKVTRRQGDSKQFRIEAGQTILRQDDKK